MNDSIRFLDGSQPDSNAWPEIWQGFLDFLGIIIWPIALLLLVVFFRRVFAFFLLSMHEVNIFGSGFKFVKSPMEVINDCVAKKFDEQAKTKQMEEEKKAEIAQYASQLEKLKSEDGDLKKLVDRAVNLAESLLEDVKKANDENMKLTQKLNTIEEEAIEKGRQEVIDNPHEFFEPDYLGEDRDR